MKAIGVQLTREEVNQHITEFFARGGEVQEVPQGLSGFEFKTYTESYRDKKARHYMEVGNAQNNKRADGGDF